MTRQANQSRAPSATSYPENDVDLLTALWNEAPFARVPADAPQELLDFVRDVENPKRVYAIYHASRRHGFQLLVEKFIVQLRYGCDSKTCSTPSCFTYRKRAVGRAPIRRFNITSARALAVYLASQDNPESNLCSNVRQPKEAPAAVHLLSFSPSHESASHTYALKVPETSLSSSASSSTIPLAPNGTLKSRPSSPRTTAAAETTAHTRRRYGVSEADAQQSRLLPQVARSDDRVGIRISERPPRRDSRSFTAGLFSTVAFKMLEWLSPNGVEYMTKKIKQVEDQASCDHLQGEFAIHTREKEVDLVRETSKDEGMSKEDHLEEYRAHNETSDWTDISDTSSQPPHSYSRPISRRNSTVRVRTPTGSKLLRQLPLDSFSLPLTQDTNPLITSLNGTALSPEKIHILPMTNHVASSACLDTTEATLPPLLLASVDQSVLVSGDVDESSSPKSIATDSPDSQSVHSLEKLAGSPMDQDTTPSSQSTSPSADVGKAARGPFDALLPQTLSHLSIPVIDLFCNILCTDGTLEGPYFEAFPPEWAPKLKALCPIKRRIKCRRTGPRDLDRCWQLFIQQGLFDVLSDPRSLVRSFTTNQNLLDTHTLWYCMMRLTRVAPSLVLDSLWIAANSLFSPPRCLLSPRSPTARVFGSAPSSISNIDAGFVMSICLHALVATVPVVTSARMMRDISDALSSGVALAQGGNASMSLRAISIQYNDVFSNEMALRLARRLFAALATRRHFADLIECDDRIDETAADVDLLKPLFAQLENSEPAAVLEFPMSARPAFDARIPTLLLDWAKTMVMREWNGRPDFSGDGPFGGALALMAAMHGNRERLMLGDLHFRLDMVGERLDATEMPVAWLSFATGKRKHHLLDYPFIFSPDTLVSFFRTINFSRMSAYFEEANTIPARIDSIHDSEVVLSEHHRALMDELLSTASQKYLVLNIRRTSPLEDALTQLWRRERRELIRPLKVRLGEDTGEEGFDSGGVQQEFFRLAIAECLDPDYGAFSLDDRTRMTWFVPGSLVENWKYEMIGLLVSLAVHNGITLPVTFPRALYRKLLGKSVCELHHIADGWPHLGAGLTALLEWDEKDGLVEEIFARTYEFSVSLLGVTVSHDMTRPLALWPQSTHLHTSRPSAMTGGSGKGAAVVADGGPLVWENSLDAPMVTNANRNGYVTDYIRYLTDDSVRPQFEAFERGFRSCLHPRSLRLLTPSLLQAVVEGVQEIELSELKRHTRYVGWDEHHKAVRDFWAVVRRYDDTMKRRLLEFVTASDRVPVGGMRQLQFVIQKNGSEEGTRGRLPTAYTCYGTLLLPEYRDREVLRERLGMALENARGFGFA